jgi:hypothetical protein
MQIIDHRILIPVPSQVVWDMIRDIARNPTWQVDCESVSFITPRREGPGVRWRYSTGTGHDSVVEISAWYNRIGYEYRYIDGMPFRQNNGRIRLQEIPEGTVVQWTFSYEPGGLFSGRRIARQLDEAIQANLDSLKKQFSQSRSPRAFASKSVMQDAPDVETRGSYKPRHPSQAAPPPQIGSQPMIVEPPIQSGDLEPFTPIAAPIQQTPAISEPPVRESDTRPRPTASPTPIKQASRLDDTLISSRLRLPEPPAGEPDFLANFHPETDRTPAFPMPAVVGAAALPVDDPSPFEPPIAVEDTKPTSAIKPVSEAALTAPEPQAADSAPPPASEMPRVALEAAAATLPPALETSRSTSERPAAPAVEPPAPQRAADDTPIFPKMPKIEPEVVSSADAAPRTETQRADESATRSIWEIFGVPRPTEIIDDKQTETPAPSSPPSAPSAASVISASAPETHPPSAGDTTTYMLVTARMGLRARRRRDLARVRRLP